MKLFFFTNSVQKFLRSKMKQSSIVYTITEWVKIMTSEQYADKSFKRLITCNGNRIYKLTDQLSRLCMFRIIDIKY